MAAVEDVAELLGPLQAGRAEAEPGVLVVRDEVDLGGESLEQPDETVRVLWSGPVTVTNTVHNALTAEITDPGNAGAIPITDSGHVDLVTAAAETRTLAAPTYVGQLLLLSLKTDGGDCVVTCATTVNQTENNTITLGDAGDAILLVAKANGANKRWSVVSNDGCALSTV